jgi:hypothetical protein
MSNPRIDWPTCQKCGSFARSITTIPTMHEGTPAVYRVRKCQNRHSSLTIEHWADDQAAMNAFLPPGKKIEPAPTKPKKKGPNDPLEPIPDKLVPVMQAGKIIGYQNGVTGEWQDANEDKEEDEELDLLDPALYKDD